MLILLPGLDIPAPERRRHRRLCVRGYIYTVYIYIGRYCGGVQVSRLPSGASFARFRIEPLLAPCAQAPLYTLKLSRFIFFSVVVRHSPSAWNNQTAGASSSRCGATSGRAKYNKRRRNYLEGDWENPLIRTSSNCTFQRHTVDLFQLEEATFF